nr:prolactin regulatory element-binding protein [Chelonoidis abingdonii]
MKKVLEFKAHDGEIEDIALGPENKVVTAGRDFQCCVWQRDQLVLRLRWDENLPGVPDKTYRYQACRFGTVPDQAEALRLYTVQVPHKRGRRPPPCYLTKWDGKSFLPLLTQPCGGEVISCLSVRYGDGGWPSSWRPLLLWRAVVLPFLEGMPHCRELLLPTPWCFEGRAPDLPSASSS